MVLSGKQLSSDVASFYNRIYFVFTFNILALIYCYNIELVKHDFLPRERTAQLELTLDVNVSYICSV